MKIINPQIQGQQSLITRNFLLKYTKDHQNQIAQNQWCREKSVEQRKDNIRFLNWNNVREKMRERGL